MEGVKKLTGTHVHHVENESDGVELLPLSIAGVALFNPQFSLSTHSLQAHGISVSGSGRRGINSFGTSPGRLGERTERRLSGWIFSPSG